MKLHPFKKARPSEEMNLQITSMADIFVIILVFLLKSYATGAVALTPTKGTTLPVAHAANDLSADALKVEVSETAVQVEGVPVVKLKAFTFDAGDLQANGSSALLGEALKKQRDRQLYIAQRNSSVKVDSRIVVLSDQRAPYSTVKTVLASAALNGYTDFKLAVVRGD